MPVSTITTVIPTLSRARCLAETLNLLQKQSRPPDQIVVVDQTPTYTRSEQELVDAAIRSSKAVYIHQKQLNASMARNKGLACAKGQVTLFLDDDVRFGPDLVQEHLMTYGERGVTGVAGQIRFEGKVRSDRPLLSRISSFGWLLFPLNYDKGASVASGASGNLSVLTDCARSLGGMDENYQFGGFREESDFCIRYSRAFGLFRFSPRAWVETLAFPTGGIRALPDGVMRRHHLSCEAYFIAKNISCAEAPVHITACLYRQWYLRRNLTDFLFQKAPMALAELWNAYTNADRLRPNVSA